MSASVRKHLRRAPAGSVLTAALILPLLLPIARAEAVGPKEGEASPAAPEDENSTPLPGTSEENEDGRDEGGTEFTAEADVELVSESRGGETSTELTFDEVTLGAESDWWEVEAGIKYNAGDGDRLILEEGALRLGHPEEFPLSVRIGRTALPFAEFDLLFLSDPFTVQLGETQDDAIVVAAAVDGSRVEWGVYREELGSSGRMASAVSLTLAGRDRGPFRAASLTASWTQDLTESTELREFHLDRVETLGAPGGDGVVSPRSVTGGGAVGLTLETGRGRMDLGYVTALDTIRAGFAAGGSLHPSAWHLEAGHPEERRLRLAVRAEGSRQMPEAARLQYGIAAAFRISENLGLAGELLHADFEAGPNGLTFGLVCSLAL